MNAVGRLAFASLLSLALGSSALALEVELEVGLGGLVPSQGWTPLKVRCRLSATDPPLRGRLVLDRPDLAIGAYSTRLDAEPGGLAIATLCVPVGTGKSYAVRVEDAAGRTLASAEPTAVWQELDHGERLVVSLGDGLSALGGKGKGKPRLARVAPRDLPSAARALERVAAIFVPGDASAELSDLCRDPRAVETLRDYVLDGGRLILMARPGVPPPWRGSPLEALVPVQRTRLETIRGEDLELAVGAMPEGARLSVATGALRPLASWRHEAGRTGLVAELRHGAGATCYVAFNLEDTRVREAKKLSRFLNSLAPERARSLLGSRSRRLLHELGYEIFQGRRPLQPVGFGLLTLAIALHVLVLGPLASALSRRRGPWAGFLLPPALSLLIGGLILVAAAATRGPAELRAVAFVVHDGASRRDVQLELALFAGGSGAFAVDLPRGWSPSRGERSGLDALNFRAPVPTLEFADGHPQRVGPLTVAAKGFTQLRLRGRDETPGGPRFRLRRSPENSERLELVNTGDQGVNLLTLASFTEQVARWQLLPALGPGSSHLLDPKAGGPVPSSSDVELEGDLFDPDDVFALPAVYQRAVSLLHHAYSMARRDGNSVQFPSSWGIAVEPQAALPVTVSGDAGPLSPEQVHCVRVHLIPLEDQ